MESFCQIEEMYSVGPGERLHAWSVLFIELVAKILQEEWIGSLYNCKFFAIPTDGNTNSIT